MKTENILPILAEASGGVAWASTIVALALLVFIGAITVVAIRKYPTVDEALKICGIFSGILGVIVGSFGAYFFTRQAAEAKIELTQQKADERVTEIRKTASVQLASAQLMLSQMFTNLDQATQKKLAALWTKDMKSLEAQALLVLPASKNE